VIIAANGQSALDFDTALAKLWGDYAEADTAVGRYIYSLHEQVGDKRNHSYGRRGAWRMTDESVLELASEAALRQLDVLKNARGAILRQIGAMDAIYSQAPWQRFFECMASGGHIHSTWNQCFTVEATTDMQWRPRLSGATIAEAVAELGETLCTFCFPDAPAEWKNGTSRRDQAARDARAAEAEQRAAARAVKTLTSDEVFRAAYSREKVTTVAKCKELIRAAIAQAVEVEYYRSPIAPQKWTGDPETLALVTASAAEHLVQKQGDAAEAERILLAREAAHAGRGATADEIARIRERKETAARREWGL